MKQVHRQFDIVIDVPDDTDPDNCEIVVDSASATYTNGAGQVIRADYVVNALHDPEEY